MTDRSAPPAPAEGASPPAAAASPAPPRIGMVSLGCPKALVDSERILARLRADGYALSPTYDGADAVIVNTCGFLDTAKAESLEAIGEAVKENGRVIVTGCLGADADTVRRAHPNVLAVTGPQQFEQVMAAVHAAAPPASGPFFDLAPPPRAPRNAGAPDAAGAETVPEAALERVALTPRHYAYLKISEGCNHRCSFCIIPSMRGDLRSRPASAVLAEAERLVDAGVRELVVISQDTSAYGVDLKHAESDWRGRPVRAHIVDLARALGELGVWVRLHYVYPYPHVDQLIPLMAEDRILPYLDIPFQHASPTVLKAMRRPANQERTLERLEAWRRIEPDIALRSTFIVGFPGETEADFEQLLAWLDAAQLDRVGCFKFEPVAGAAANTLADPVPEAVKEERHQRFMERAMAISAAKLRAKIGARIDVIVDEVDAEGAICRGMHDAPGEDVDGQVFIDSDFDDLAPGEILEVEIDEASEYDLWGARV